MPEDIVRRGESPALAEPHVQNRRREISDSLFYSQCPYTDSQIITANNLVANKIVGMIRLNYYADSQKSRIQLGRRGQILR